MCACPRRAALTSLLIDRMRLGLLYVLGAEGWAGLGHRVRKERGFR